MRRRTTIKPQDKVTPCPESTCPCCCSEEYFESEDGKVFICNSCHYSTANYDTVRQQLEEFNLVGVSDEASRH